MLLKVNDANKAGFMFALAHFTTESDARNTEWWSFTMHPTEREDGANHIKLAIESTS